MDRKKGTHQKEMRTDDIYVGHCRLEKSYIANEYAQINIPALLLLNFLYNRGMEEIDTSPKETREMLLEPALNVDARDKIWDKSSDYHLSSQLSCSTRST